MASNAHHQVVTDPVAVLRDRFVAAIRAAFASLEGDIDPMIVPSKQAGHADYQSNAAMGLSKRLGKPPRDVAAEIVAKLDVSDVCEAVTPASIAGPGFINLRLKASALADALMGMDNASLGVEQLDASRVQTIVVDLMGVNLAKQMHVGHLRSPIIGDAIARLMQRLGHKVIRQNHVGDWGLPIAMVTARVMRLQAVGTLDINKITLDDLDKAYAAAQRECQRDVEGLKAAQQWNMGPKAVAELEAQVEGATSAFLEARQTLLKLQQKEPATYAVWQKIYEVTMKVCIEVCQLLEVRVTNADSAGESSYADELASMVDDLMKRGIAIEDQGAIIVRLDKPSSAPVGNANAGARDPHADEADPIKEPCLIRKTDGGFLYATTDVCAVRRRVQKLGAHRAIYAIDARQNLHLRQVFLTSKIAGYATHPTTGRWSRFDHAAFGSVLGEDGKPFKTRSGDSVKLADLIRETFDRADKAVRSKCAERGVSLSDEEFAKTSRCVGIAALKYADLSTDKAKDYVFSFDRMLAFEGDTGPYLLYGVVRIKNIFRKAAEAGVGNAWAATPLNIAEPAEKALALALLRYPSVLRSTADTIELHRLCQYAFELAGAFSSFYDKCPVLNAGDAKTRDSRLRLCDLTRRVLEDALGCVGITAPERM
ncbi:MAG: arginine--tRNA ligase [Phycisphaerales bacterium]